MKACVFVQMFLLLLGCFLGDAERPNDSAPAALAGKSAQSVAARAVSPVGRSQQQPEQAARSPQRTAE
jgi:hypothetical protein